MPIEIQDSNQKRIITVNRPEVRNAYNPETAAALYQAFVDFDADDSVDIAILTGAGGAFCAGYDLKAFAADPENALATRQSWHFGTDETPPQGPMGPSRLQLSKPVIAAIAGPAVAGGLEMATWCDLRVADETAYFGVFCRRFGVPLIDGGTVRLPRLIGQSRALDMILTGRKVDAQEALDIGLVNRLVPTGQALIAALELADLIRSFPPECMRADRHSACTQWGLTEAEALQAEFAGSEQLLANESLSGATQFAAGKGRHGNIA